MLSTRQTNSAAGRHRFARFAAILLLGVTPLLLAGCNDKEDHSAHDPNGTAAGQRNVSGTAASGTASAGRSVVREIGKTGWWDGFTITVNKATVVPGGANENSKVRIDLTYKNNTGKAAAVDSSILFLENNGKVDNVANYDIPTVPGKGSAAGTISTSVPQTSDFEHLLDKLTVVFGQGSDNQTKFPLAASAKAESVQPKALTVTGKLVQAPITVEITGGELAPSYKKGEQGKMTVALNLKLSCGTGCAAGGYNVWDDDFKLETSSGTIAADERGNVNELLSSESRTIEALTPVVFVLPAPGTGTYTLSYNNKVLSNLGATPATLVINVA
ncbi:hypothetical protein [Nocardia inohanensis]|uniref:hypothetical protein n=1 Tax=Nocardia inohanensis TaxID=209246 RepID=UPI0008326D01|nr:hypothetical protein [Nocardia inohanensis]